MMGKFGQMVIERIGVERLDSLCGALVQQFPPIRQL
jgi:hypothetical protein